MKHYVLITKNSCDYCEEAIKLLKREKVSFVYTDMENAPGILETTKEQINWPSVPMIWEQDIEIDSQPRVNSNDFIGGYDDLLSHLSEKQDD